MQNGNVNGRGNGRNEGKEDDARSSLRYTSAVNVTFKVLTLFRRI